VCVCHTEIKSYLLTYLYVAQYVATCQYSTVIVIPASTHRPFEHVSPSHRRISKDIRRLLESGYKLTRQLSIHSPLSSVVGALVSVAGLEGEAAAAPFGAKYYKNSEQS